MRKDEGKITEISAGEIIRSLENNGTVFKGLLEGAPEGLIHWRPGKDKWCLKEIVCHLLDEEKEDFRLRVKTTLETPGATPPPIDPVGWVSSRKYMDRDYADSVAALLNERKASIVWLKQLRSPAWDNGFEHRHFGKMTAGLFLANWLAHDFLHIRQIIRLHHQYLGNTTREDLRYAGEW